MKGVKQKRHEIKLEIKKEKKNLRADKTAGESQGIPDKIS